MENVPMTKQGVTALELELDRLINVERKKVIKAIAEAREHGDLKENAEYHAAKEEQAFIEGHILEIESKLSRVQVIDVKKLSGEKSVVFGATVELEIIETSERHTYQIVGEDEADIKKNKLSYLSPICRALINKVEGEEVVVKAPKGNIVYEIVAIRYI